MPKQPLQTLVRHLHKLVRPSESGPADDRDLLLRFVKRRDALAFAALVEWHGPMVRGVCKRLLRQESDVDDAFQATFLVLLRKAHSIRKTQSLGSWLYGVAFRIACRARAQHKSGIRSQESGGRNQRSEFGKQAPRSTTTDPSMEAAWRELCAVLDAEVHGLAEKYRAPIVLCYLEGQTRDQAARQLGWSLRTLDRRLEEGRERLRARLARRGITLSAALLATGLSQQAGLCAVPAAVLEQTLQAACGLAAGQTAAAISPKAIVLAETVLKGAVPMKLKVLAGVFLVAAVAVGGAGALAHQMLAAKPQAASEAKHSKPADLLEKQTKNDGSKPARTDLYGDPLPPGAIARLGTVRFRHGEDVHCVAITRGGERVISGGLDGIRVWDYASGKQLRQICDHDFRGGRFSLSTDDRLLAARGRSTMSVRLFDLTTGRELRQLGGNNAYVSAFAFCPDSRTFAACEEKTVRLFDPLTGNELGLIELQDGGVQSLLSSPDGKVLAAADSKAIHLLDIMARRETRRLPMPYWQKMVFSLDGRTLYAGNSEGKIRVWDVASGEERRPFRETPWVGSLALSPDGKMLAAGDDGIGARAAPHVPVLPLYIWDVASGRELLRIEAGPVSSMSFSRDGKELVTVGDGHALRFWNATTGRERPRPAGHEGPISYIALSPDGTTLVTGAWSQPLWLWDLGTGRQLRQLRLADGRFLDLKFTRDGKNLLSLGYDPHTINLWDVADGRELRQVGDVVGDYYFRLIMSPDGQTLVLPNLELRALATGKKIGQLAGGSKVQMGCISPDGKLLAARVGWSEFVLSDLTTGKELRHWRPSSQVLCIAFTPDSKAIATGDQDQQIILWDAATGKQLRIFLGHEDMVAALAFSPDGRMLASGCSGTADRKDKTVRLWEVATGQERRCLRGHQSFVQALAFTPDGRRLISGSLDGTVLVWDTTGQSPDSPVRSEDLTPAKVQMLWDALAGADAAKAYEAIGTLAAAPAPAVPFFKDRLQPVAGVDPRHIKQLIDLLNHDQFEERERATAALATILDHAEPALRRKLAEARLAPEQRRRIERLLEDVKPLPPQSLREVRAIEVLEHIGTPEAQQVLKTLAKGASEARLTQEAKAALERLARRSASTP